MQFAWANLVLVSGIPEPQNRRSEFHAFICHKSTNFRWDCGKLLKTSKTMKKISSILLIGILAITFGCTKDNSNDNGGGSSSNNSAPTCTITSPQNGTTFSLSDNIPVTVSASDPDGTIVEVKLSIDEMEYQSVTSSPYNFTITSGIVSSGVHTIKAIAKDNSGATAQSSIVIIIEGNPSGNNVAPTCIITTPQNGTSFAYDENINVSVFAEDSDGTIVKVSLYIDNIGYSEMTDFPYNFTIVSGVMSPGTHTIKAIAKDDGGSNGEASVTITIEEPATESPDFVSFSDGQIPPTWQTATWFVDNTGGYDDIYSLKVEGSGSVMTTKTIQGNGYLEFYAKDSYHQLSVYIDGSTKHYYTTETVGSWTKFVFDIDEGTHTILWEYNGSGSRAIDAIRFIHNSTNPRIGEYYQGGYIAYLDNARQHGYVISENDLGRYNHSDAIDVCYNYSSGQYTDWHLPDRYELETILNCLWMAQSTILPIASTPIYNTDCYWSSSWDGYSNINPQYISGYIVDSGVCLYSWSPSYYCKVRAIRSF